MQTVKTDDVRIVDIQAVADPATIIAEMPLSADAAGLVTATRRDIHEVLNGSDDRLIVVTGPCSIHDPDAAIAYAQKLLPMREEYRQDLILVMRVYFEKPRTTVGWKGLINDPDLDESFDINKGLRTARRLLLAILFLVTALVAAAIWAITSFARRPRSEDAQQVAVARRVAGLGEARGELRLATAELEGLDGEWGVRVVEVEAVCVRASAMQTPEPSALPG